MTKQEYQKVRKDILPLLKANNLKASANLGLCLIFFSLTIWGSQSSNTLIWISSQVLMGVSILQFFFLFHDLGHQNFFSSKKANIFIGHIIGLICALPYYPWHYIHSTHHNWTGWREKDPTLPKITKNDLSESQKKIINFCWKYYIPIFTSVFAVFNFWNYNKLNTLFSSSKEKRNNLISLLFIVSVYSLICAFAGPMVFIKTYALGLFVFLVLSDPLLISQHAGIRQKSIEGVQNLKPLPYYKQEQFTRSLNFPKFINNYILFGFNQHSIHHLFPKLPCYNLIQVQTRTSINLNWRTWIKAAKQTPASDFMFEVNNDHDHNYGELSHLNFEEGSSTIHKHSSDHSV